MARVTVSLQVAFTVGARRNWLNLWKPTIDAMEQILGRSQPERQWHPRDGRIVELGLHHAIDPALGNNVRIAILARSAVGDLLGGMLPP